MMDYELELTKANRLKVSKAFRFNKRVDFSIECLIEGQLGKVFVNDLARPTAYCITVGPFWYFAGDARSPGGYQLMQGLPAYNILMPSPDPWSEVAQEIYGENLKCFTRYSFSAAELSREHLTHLLESSPHQQRVIPISMDVAKQLAGQVDGYLDLSDFDSAEDFAERGLGYTMLDDGKAMGVAYSSLVCSQGIEVSIFVDEPYRRQGVATALASKLLLASLQYNLRPNWDAANLESVGLAKKLGYHYLEAYDAYYHTKK
jgi:GNAT superfamily N-acetyltransferase